MTHASLFDLALFATVINFFPFASCQDDLKSSRTAFRLSCLTAGPIWTISLLLAHLVDLHADLRTAIILTALIYAQPIVLFAFIRHTAHTDAHRSHRS